MAKCEDTDSDMYYCINANKDQADCENQEEVLFFPGEVAL